MAGLSARGKRPGVRLWGLAAHAMDFSHIGVLQRSLWRTDCYRNPTGDEALDEAGINNKLRWRDI